MAMMTRLLRYCKDLRLGKKRYDIEERGFDSRDFQVYSVQNTELDIY